MLSYAYWNIAFLLFFLFYICTKFTKAKQSSSVVILIGCKCMILLKEVILLLPQHLATHFRLSSACASVYMYMI